MRGACQDTLWFASTQARQHDSRHLVAARASSFTQRMYARRVSKRAGNPPNVVNRQIWGSLISASCDQVFAGISGQSEAVTRPRPGAACSSRRVLDPIDTQDFHPVAQRAGAQTEQTRRAFGASHLVTATREGALNVGSLQVA